MAYVREFWSVRAVASTSTRRTSSSQRDRVPQPVRRVSPISIPRGGQDSSSVRWAATKFPVGDFKLQRASAGLRDERDPDAYVSALTWIAARCQLARRGLVFIGERLRLDAVYSHVFASDVTVTAADAAIQRVNPVKGNPTQTTAVNGGRYSVQGDVIGLGMHIGSRGAEDEVT